jgi:hypothetical protein
MAGNNRFVFQLVHQNQEEENADGLQTRSRRRTVRFFDRTHQRSSIRQTPRSGVRQEKSRRLFDLRMVSPEDRGGELVGNMRFFF